MSILERRREIGIMKAIGASDGDVQKLFFAEAGAMGIFGGAVGVLLGWIIGRAINFGTRVYMQRQQQFTPDDVWLVPLWLVLGAIGFSLIVSLLAGLYPAERAARLEPNDLTKPVGALPEQQPAPRSKEVECCRSRAQCPAALRALFRKQSR